MHVPGLDRVRERRRRLRSEIIYLVAPTGYPNYGDELIARAWLRHLARARPHATVVLDCHTPGQAALLLRGAHPNVLFTDTLWQLTLYAADTARTSGPDASIPWVWAAEAATEFGPAPRLAEGVDLFRQASSVHLLGGGYLNQVWPHHISLVAAAAALARTTGAQAYATGQGLIPTVEGPSWKAFTESAAEFTVFDVRDSASADALAGVAARRHTGDDAWLAVDEHRPTAPEPGHPGGVTLCVQSDLTDDFAAFGMTGREALTAFVSKTLDAWEVPGEAITVVEGIPGIDLEIPTRLGARLDGSTTIPFFDVWRRGLPVGRGDAWISTRFHPHLVAAAAGDSGVAVIGRPDYYATKHQSLVASGSRWTVVDDPDAIPERPTAGGFSPADRDHAVAAKRALAQRLYPDNRY
ncbi:polysaccharide pyruvyl transferase family protein [Gordonia sp. CPCC 206044]|uniref:polysaccharide pyruvyl transferase family protein n=1 Tax=Gordonia sp. CPCC 206044 TaxID=3140793 RepID=UPI003AF38BF6